MVKDPRAVNELVIDALQGRASRRDVMKRAVALGLSAPVIGALLTISEVAARDGENDEDAIDS